MSVIYLTAQEAAIIMGCSPRYILYLWERYMRNEPGGLKCKPMPGQQFNQRKRYRTTEEWIREAMGDPAPPSEPERGLQLVGR